MAIISAGRLRRMLGVLLVAVAAGLAGPQCARAIQGGAPARSADQLARATVAVGTVSRPSGQFRLSRCTGVLIGADLVLTAAHCVRDDPVAVAVLLYDGSRPVHAPQWVAAVATTAIAPGDIPADDFVGALHELSFDIAVLRLASPVRGRKPLSFARGLRQLPATMRLAGAGWSGRSAGMLQTATLKPLFVTDTGVTIARAVGAEVCVGDSGGPVVVPGRNGPVIWGVAAAVISQRRPCSSIVVIAPAGRARVPG